MFGNIRKPMKRVNRKRNKIQPSPDGWFNYWHTHDWNYKNDQYRDFNDHIKEIDLIYEYVKGMALKIQGEYQIWIILDPQDPLQDSVYLHTPNPNSEFPHDMSYVQWLDEIPSQYHLLRRHGRFGQRVYKEFVTYVIMDIEA